MDAPKPASPDATASPQALRLRCADGFELPATWFAPPAPATPVAVAVIAPGLGIPRGYYAKFAADLAARGIAALTFDYRGIGEAAAALADPRATRMQDWGRLDTHAALAEAFARYPQMPIFLVGHSAGAQLVGLSPLSERLAGLVFVAGPRPHASQDRGGYRLFSTFWWYVMLPLGSLGRWFPARRLGFSAVDVPAGVTAEWGRWARSPRYLFSPEHGIDTSRYARLTQPILALSFSDDTYTPPASAKALLSEYPNAAIEHRQIRPRDVSVNAIGHLGFFRSQLRNTLWRDVGDWILKQAAAAARGAAA